HVADADHESESLSSNRIGVTLRRTLPSRSMISPCCLAGAETWGEHCLMSRTAQAVVTSVQEPAGSRCVLSWSPRVAAVLEQAPDRSQEDVGAPRKAPGA